jgi:hypothetical protein
MRTETTHSLAGLTGADVAALVGAPPEPRRVVGLPVWSRPEAAAAAASLANTDGGLIVVGAATAATGAITGIGSAGVSEAELAAIAGDLSPEGAHLINVKLVDVGGSRCGIVRVAESADPPVVVEGDGGIYRRTEAGLQRVTSRSDLDQLYEKGRGLRARAVTNLDALLKRISFDHSNYMTIAVAAAPRFAGPYPYEWVVENQAALVDPSLPFVRRCALDASSLQVTPGEVTISLPGDSTGFIRIVRNGCIAVGQRLMRPAQDQFVSPAELSAELAEMVDVLAMPYRATSAGLILGAALLEGVRDLRLPVPGGLTMPTGKDLVERYLPERYLEDPGQRADFVRDLQEAVGSVFNADLVNGTGEPYAGPVESLSLDHKSWHGTTKRTERRLTGARGHGSV